MTSTVSHLGKTRVAFACGGSGGDVYPALAVAEALPDGFEAIILGSTTGLEARLAEQRGHRFLATPAAPLAGTGPRGKAISILATATGTASARRLLRRERARVVLGFGGYASVPAVLAACSLDIPALLFEANAVVGTANRWLERFAQHVLLGTDVAAGSIRGPHTVTGVPVRAELSSVRAAIPREPLGVLVCGGSFGSRFLDDAAAPLLRLVAAAGITLDVHHVGDPRCAGAAYERAGIVARVVAFENDMAAAYARASFAIVSAGAVTLAEIAAVGLPALVVPSSAVARDHQTANARAFAAASGAAWCREADWDPQALARRIVQLARSPSAWSQAADTMRAASRPAATAAVVRACLEAVSALRPSGGADEAT